MSRRYKTWTILKKGLELLKIMVNLVLFNGMR